MPSRIQRKRTKGWRLPEGAVIVTRPTVFGNPFTGPDAVEAFRAMMLDKIFMVAIGVEDENGACLHNVFIVGRKQLDVSCCDTYSEDIPSFWDIYAKPIMDRMSDLRGRDLACYCGLGKSCHADVLLEIANYGVKR